jgi:serine/threonine protein kinase
MTERLLDPRSTAAVLLGASDWTDAGLGSAPSFGRSAKELLNYLTHASGLGLDPDLIIDLFNDRTYAGEQLGYVRDTLGRRIKERSEAGHPVSDVIIYYLGHGVTDEQAHLSLLVRRSINGMEVETGIRAPDLARTLKLAAPKQRRMIVLDCCFAEAAIKAFIGMSAPAKSLSASVAKDFADGLPASGGLLLCSAPANEIAVGAPNAEHTLFTGALLQVLQSGLGRDQPFFSFTDLRDATYQIMLEKFGAGAPYPVLHPFSPAHGDLAQYPAFPNIVKESKPAPDRWPPPADTIEASSLYASNSGDGPSDPRIGQRLQRIGFWFSEEVIPDEDLDFVMSAALEERNDRASMVIRRVIDSPKARAGDVMKALAGIRDRGGVKPLADPTIGPRSPPGRIIAPSPAAEIRNAERESQAADRLAHLLERQAPQPVPIAEPADQFIGKYKIKGVLGRGASGTVYDGLDPVIDRRVAIKTVSIGHFDDPESVEAVERFRKEARAAGRLSHPNIVGVFDYGETGETAYIVMEFMAGPSLYQLLKQDTRFRLDDINRMMEDLFAALAFSHENGVVHRDIKPGNVMLTTHDYKTCRFKLSDFGIARIESSSVTVAGTLLGTPAYMAPEQFIGTTVDQRTDIYACGVLIYQLLTGQRPFEGGMSAIMHKALNTDPLPPSQIADHVPRAMDDVVRRAMAKRPEDRFQSVMAFRNALQAAMTGNVSPPAATVLPAGPAEPDRPSVPRSRQPAGIIIAAVFIIFGFILLWVLLGRH